jgi:tetratricopeptide (TPR) repeat protein
LLVNLAQVYRVQRRWDDALQLLDRCVDLAPKHAGYRVARGLAHRDAGHTQSAIADLDWVLERNPESAEAHFAKAEMLLARGSFASGWVEYRWRPDRIAWLASQAMAADSPPHAADSLRGRDIVLHGEQGLGDTLFFLRFVPRIAELARIVSLEIDPRLRAILPQYWRAERPKEALALLVGDVPAILEPLPVPSMKLQAEQARVAVFRERLAHCGPPPYVGLTWQAGVRWEQMRSPGESLFKRVPPERLGQALRQAGGTLISLQRSPAPHDAQLLGAAAQKRVHDLSSVNQDLRDAVALLAILDDYIAVSNTNVHLNEALGKRTRVLVTHPAEWRWTAKAERSPWFERAALYRQAADGSWQSALERLGADLERK